MIFAVCLALLYSDNTLEPFSRESLETTLVRQKNWPDVRSPSLRSGAYPDGFDAIQTLAEGTYLTHPTVQNAHPLIDDHQADFVVRFRPYANDGRCGYAWIGGYQQAGDFSNPQESEFGYSVVSTNCSD